MPFGVASDVAPTHTENNAQPNANNAGHLITHTIVRPMIKTALQMPDVAPVFLDAASVAADSGSLATGSGNELAALPFVADITMAETQVAT